MSDAVLPAALQEIADDFAAVSAQDRLQLLLDFSRGLPDLPPHLADHPDLARLIGRPTTPLVDALRALA